MRKSRVFNPNQLVLFEELVAIELPPPVVNEVKEVIYGGRILKRGDLIFIRNDGTWGRVWRFFPTSCRDQEGNFSIKEDEKEISIITPFHPLGFRVSVREIDFSRTLG